MTDSLRKQAAPCGTWTSPISAAVVAAGAAPLTQVLLDGADVYWLAGRASEGGRNTLLRQRGTQVEELTPVPFNVRTRVHEYGGGATLVADGTVWFSHFVDNRIYRIGPDGGDPQPVSAGGDLRFADFVLDAGARRAWSACAKTIRRAPPTPSIRCARWASMASKPCWSRATIFIRRRACPRTAGRSPGLSWDNPRMPWQGTELWLAEIGADGTLRDGRLIAGGTHEAIVQPGMVAGRSAVFRLRPQRLVESAPLPGRHGAPGVPARGRIRRPALDVREQHVRLSLGERNRLHVYRGWRQPPGARGDGQRLPDGHRHALRGNPRTARGRRRVLLLGGAPTLAAQVARIDLATGTRTVLARSIETLPDAGYLSVPHSVAYPSANGRTSYAFYYPPANRDVEPLPGELPPLMVIGHGGPTSMATSTLKLATQFWTSRGVAVLDVNYGGSTGFGRAYRNLLEEQWGIVDVEDCVAGAHYLAERGLVDRDRLVIRGGSAGGLTTLCALAFHDVFKAGASYYGVSDLKGLDADSHKFEARYTEYLIAPKARADAVYAERSPINHADKLRRPMIFFQGLDDKVVPPPQSEVMVAALRAQGVPVAYLTLEGEGHGFRKLDSIVRTLEAELYFYLRVFGIPVPADLPPIEIENLAA